MLSKIIPSVFSALFYIYCGALLLLRFLFSNLWGILVFSILIYQFAPVFGISPFNSEQLVLWIEAQPQATKAALLGSFITIIGFLIAYATATANWKAQLLAQLKLQASNEIESFFNRAGSISTDCQIFAESLIEAVNKIQNGCSNDEALFLVQYNCQQVSQFLSNRDQLSAMGIESHRFQGRYNNILISAPFMVSNLRKAVASLNKITSDMWFRVPFIQQNDPNPVQTFLNQINVAECMRFVDSTGKHYDQLGLKAGGLHGALQSSVVPFNVWSFLYLLRERKNFESAMKTNFEHSGDENG